jgi:hypothetical protein
MTLFELKEKAKWSRDPEEKKTAITELSTHGENAISELQEIMNITGYDDIKNACAEAIKSIQASSKLEVNETSTNDNSNPSADVTTRDKKKKNSKRKSKARKKQKSG